MVTRKRIDLDSTSWDGGADLPLLYLSMKLITSQPRVGFEAAENYLYTASKRFLSLLESAGTASILYLQALVLVALYEYGQGIYPAAWMTVGQCVRYADFLGLPSYEESNVILGQCVRAPWPPGSVMIRMGSLRRDVELTNFLGNLDRSRGAAQDLVGCLRHGQNSVSRV